MGKWSEDFTEEEKETIVEECTIKLIGPKVLSEKYNTTTHVIKCFIQAKGHTVTPDDLSKFPNFPRKTEEMSNEEYQKLTLNYMQTIKKKEKRDHDLKNRQIRKKAEREFRTQRILETMIPEDLEGHPDFPEYLEGTTHEQYADKIERYWENQNRLKLKRKSLGLSDPNLKKKKIDNFSEVEKKSIYDDSMEKGMSREVVAKKYGTIVNVVDAIIFRLHKKHDDGPVSFESKILSEYPDYP